MEDLPKPNSQNVTLKKVNLGKTAVMRFGGWATKDRASYYQNKLSDLLAANGYTVHGHLWLRNIIHPGLYLLSGRMKSLFKLNSQKYLG